VLKVSDLRLKYRTDEGEVDAVRGLSLNVEHGQFFTLLGPSGCGKTSTLRCIAGLETPTSGSIEIDAHVVYASASRTFVPPHRRNIGMVFQSYAIWPHMTVFDNVAFPLVHGVRKHPRKVVEEKVMRALSLVQLDGLASRPAPMLSGGQQQRVALARAVASEPAVLLLDEPLSNLDANLREQMRFEIRRIHQETGITMIYVTHDQAEAMVIADRIAVMNQGRIEQIGTPREIYTRPRSRFVAGFLGQTNCLAGRLVAPGLVRCGELEFRAAEDGEFRTGDEVVLCVRPRAVRVRRHDAAGDAGLPNTIRGRLAQQAYLGDLHDLQIALPGGTLVRAFAPLDDRYEPGQELLVQFPPAACLLVRP